MECEDDIYEYNEGYSESEGAEEINEYLTCTEKCMSNIIRDY